MGDGTRGTDVLFEPVSAGSAGREAHKVFCWNSLESEDRMRR